MTVPEITQQWLQQQQFTIQPGVTIEGVHVKDLVTHLDGRGDVIELWSQSWVDGTNIHQPKHVYESSTDYGVVKGWHLHEHHTDQHTVTRGKLQISLVDVRPDSPTFGHANKVILGVQKPRLVKIPPGVMHGWKALSRPEVIVVNLQTQIYDPADEYKYTWNCILEDIWEPKNG